MEPEDPQKHEGKTEDHGDNNVVPFPRDWLGPPEDLVPFGREGRGASSNASPGPQSWASSNPPPLAQDFWGGEGSGAIHEALPAAEPGNPDRAASGRRRLRPTLAAPAIRRVRMAGLTGPLALVLLAVAGVALGAGILTAPGRPGARLARASGSGAAVARRERLAGRSHVTTKASPEKHAARPAGAAHARPAGIHRSVRRHTSTKPRETAPAVAVGYTPASSESSSGGTSNGSTSESSGSVSPPSIQPAAGQSSGSSGSSGGGAGTSSAGSGTPSTSTLGASTPTPSQSASSANSVAPRPAFGANGILGPGTSPNS